MLRVAQEAHKGEDAYVKTQEEGNIAIGCEALRCTSVHDEYFSASAYHRQ
jgi:hypothetical protein